MFDEIMNSYIEYSQLLSCWMTDNIEEAIMHEEYAIIESLSSEQSESDYENYNPWDIL